MQVVSCMQMGRTNALYHLKPLALHKNVEKLVIVRRTNLGDLGMCNAKQIVTKHKSRLFALPHMWWNVVKYARSYDVAAIVSFYAVPYGIMALLAARLHGKAVHIGFVGDDWYRWCKGLCGRVLIKLLRHADFFTCTGTHMRDEMIARGFPPERIAILPHSIDVDKVPIAAPANAIVDAIFVGNLIERKRVDTILLAWATVLKRHKNARLAIVGDGPLRTKLDQLAAQLNCAHAVTFFGHADDVYSYVLQARISIIASYMEGFPFATVEAICCGLVPVCTPVGTITDYIKHRETGMLFPVGDHTALAACVTELLDDPDLYQRIRQNVLALRQEFSYDKATAVWDVFLRQCAERDVTGDQ